MFWDLLMTTFFEAKIDAFVNKRLISGEVMNDQWTHQEVRGMEKISYWEKEVVMIIEVWE